MTQSHLAVAPHMPLGGVICFDDTCLLACSQKHSTTISYCAVCGSAFADVFGSVSAVLRKCGRRSDVTLMLCTVLSGPILDSF